jgi:hypothetical protein
VPLATLGPGARRALTGFPLRVPGGAGLVGVEWTALGCGDTMGEVVEELTLGLGSLGQECMAGGHSLALEVSWSGEMAGSDEMPGMGFFTKQRGWCSPRLGDWTSGWLLLQSPYW